MNAVRLSDLVEYLKCETLRNKISTTAGLLGVSILFSFWNIPYTGLDRLFFVPLATLLVFTIVAALVHGLIQPGRNCVGGTWLRMTMKGADAAKYFECEVVIESYFLRPDGMRITDPLEERRVMDGGIWST